MFLYGSVIGLIAFLLCGVKGVQIGLQKESESPISPYNQTGTCITINTCPSSLLPSNQSKDTTPSDFLQRSLCTTESHLSYVCCPTIPVANNTRKRSSQQHRRKRSLLKGIVGGLPAELNEFPWMAALGFRTKPLTLSFKCGATLISKRWLVTAAHCKGSTLKMTRLGDINLQDEVEDGVEPINVAIDKVIVHPNYTKEKGKDFPSDIALIRLRKNISFTKNIHPIRILDLPESKNDSFYENKSLIVTGWGSTKPYKEDDADTAPYKPSVVLLKTTLEFINSKNCGINDTNPSILCAFANGKDSCEGDSGGPLIMQFQGKPYLAGIVSTGGGCADPEYSGAYTRVAYYSDWIRNITGLKHSDDSDIFD